MTIVNHWTVLPSLFVHLCRGIILLIGIHACLAVSSQGFKYQGSPPHLAGFYFTSAGDYLKAGAQGYALMLRDGENLNALWGSGQSYDCVTTNTFSVLYDRGTVSLDGVIGPSPSNISACQFDSVSQTEASWTASDVEDVCPGNASPVNGTVQRVAHSVPNFIDLPCKSSYSLSQASKFMSSVDFAIPDVKGTFGSLKYPGGPLGFGSILQSTFPNSTVPLGIFYWTQKGLLGLRGDDPLRDSFYLQIGEFVSWECIGHNEYRATYWTAFFHSNGTVTAEARCLARRHEGNVAITSFSSTQCPENASSGRATILKRFEEKNACENFVPSGTAIVSADKLLLFALMCFLTVFP